MKVEKTQNRLQVELSGDFNLNAVRQISEFLSDRDEIDVDLTHSRFVNSKAVLFLNDLIQNQKIVRLKNPPKTFFEVLHILGLHQAWDLKNIIKP